MCFAAPRFFIANFRRRQVDTKAAIVFATQNAGGGGESNFMVEFFCEESQRKTVRTTKRN